MIHDLWHLLTANLIEVLGAFSGFLYIYFSIKQNIWLWPLGLATSALYILVFYGAGFYADMGLQFYYVFISIYGWYYWLSGGKTNVNTNKQIPISTLNLKTALLLLLVTLFLFIIIAFILVKYTNSEIPYWDALTTAFSITATWMLARKYLEHWLIWIGVDFISAGLYYYKQLYPTLILFIIYGILAILGYIKWKKQFKLQTEFIA